MSEIHGLSSTKRDSVGITVRVVVVVNVTILCCQLRMIGLVAQWSTDFALKICLLSLKENNAARCDLNDFDLRRLYA